MTTGPSLTAFLAQSTLARVGCWHSLGTLVVLIGTCPGVVGQVPAAAPVPPSVVPVPDAPLPPSTYQPQTTSLSNRLELSLRQAVAMALRNNLDIQLQREDQGVAELGIQRAAGGGTPTQISYSVAEAPAGVPLASLSLLTSSTPASVDPAGLSVSSSFDAGHVLEANHSLAIAQAPFSSGSAIPAFDASLVGQFAWLHRNPVTALANTPGGTATASNTVVTDNTLANVSLAKGFRSGASLQLGVNDFVQSFYSARSSAVPFSKPNAIALFAQPLLRGAGSSNNTRLIAVARANKKISATVLEEQMISTVSGVATLYYDLISLQSAVAVQQEALRAAETLLSNDRQQLEVGRMPPIEVARAESLVSANRLALTQAISHRDQQQIVLYTVLDPDALTRPAKLPDIVATDTLSPYVVGEAAPVEDLVQKALAMRPDLAQARLQIANGERFVSGSANARLPELDLYGAFQNRGVLGPSLIPIAGDAASGTGTLDQVPAGGRSASRIVEAGIQFNLPLQNRVASANLGADRIALKQEQIRLKQLESQAAAEVRNTSIALRAAEQATAAATDSRKLQERLLSAETEKFQAGMSSNFAVIEQQTYLTQAQTTELAAQAAYRKAKVQLDRAVGQTLQENGISLASSSGAVKP